MSAECDKHGTDLVYPGESWPVGVCPVCEKAEELESLSRLYVACRDDYERLWSALERIVRNLDGECADGNIFPVAALRIAREALAPREERA